MFISRKIIYVYILFLLSNFCSSQDQNLNLSSDSISENYLSNNLRALAKAEANNDSLAMAGRLSNIGLHYQKQGNYTKAIEVNLRSFSIYEKLLHLEGMARSLGTISLIYQAQSEYKKALEYNLKALQYNLQANFKKGIARNYTLCGLLYESLNDLDKALEYDLKALEMNRSINNRIGIIKCLNHIGEIAIQKREYERAYDHIFDGRKLSDEIKNIAGKAISLKNLGSVFYHIASANDSVYLFSKLKINRSSSLNLAYQFTDSASRIDKFTGSLDRLKDDYILLSRISEAQGNYAIALDHYHSYSLIKDTLFNLEKDKKIVQAVMKYEFAKKEDSLNLVKEKKELEYKRQIELKALAFEYEKKQALAKTEEEKRRLELEHRMKEQSIQNEFERKTERAELALKQKELERKQEEAIKIAEQEKKDIRQKNIRNIFISSLCLLAVISLFIYRNYRQKLKANFELSQQKQLVEEKNKEITDSINYARRIQNSLLISENVLKKYLPEHFVFFQPKDIVSGDFYWTHTLPDNKFLLVTADSTGHGVPGSIMSMLNIACLKEAVENYKLAEPSKILDCTRKIIIETLANDGSESGGKDGMDASLISFDFNNSKFNYSAANNPIWVVRGDQLIELNPDKMPVGKHDKDQTPFTQHEFILQKNDMIYALTDGMPDQFGGPKGKKFMYKGLKELLISISSEPVKVQKQKLNEALSSWKGDLEQVDDVTIIGVRT